MVTTVIQNKHNRSKNNFSQYLYNLPLFRLGQNFTTETDLPIFSVGANVEYSMYTSASI